MKACDEETIRTVAAVMADSFLEDPMNAAQLEGVHNMRALLETHCLIKARLAAKRGQLVLLNGDARAFLIGGDIASERWLQNAMEHIRILFSTLRILTVAELRQILRNMKVHGTSLDLDWHKGMLEGNRYKIRIIAIDKSLRGSGAFRKLITPVLQEVDSRWLPAVLETHNPANVGLYEHFGFELVREITSPSTPIRQYCMLRPPVEEQKG
jgi:ribosomal protein S18 acetylase RimI-like enzyme